MLVMFVIYYVFIHVCSDLAESPSPAGAISILAAYSYPSIAEILIYTSCFLCRCTRRSCRAPFPRYIDNAPICARYPCVYVYVLRATYIHAYT